MTMYNSTDYNHYRNRFQAYVVWVDHNGTVQDMQKKGSIESFSPGTGRNYYIGVVKLNSMDSTIAMNVMVPMSVLGEFKLPQLGDIVWIEESRRVSVGEQPTYMYSTYNSIGNTADSMGQTPPPQWGSMAGDRGEIISYRDHVRQFVPTVNSNFIKKYVRSITGYRHRQHYRGNLIQGRYAMRGDSVFDIDLSVSREYLVENGAYIGYGGNLETDQGEYPNPLNVPEEREEDENYKYVNLIHRPIEAEVDGNQYTLDSEFSYVPRETVSTVLKNKNYLSYQPVLDKTYLDKAEFERELPAAEEYQVALRGNNKLLIQDQYGDGEQLLITLKNQYDAGITILHNAENGQVRIRDHMGQGVLLEANAEAPRVMAWTKNRQVVEMGAIKDVGEFTYIRNGSAFGDSQTSFGTKTGVTKDGVSNQEFLMVSTSGIIGELSSRITTGMNNLITSANQPGIYIRNNVDPDSSEQTWAMHKQDARLTVTLGQSNTGVDGATQRTSISQTMDGTTATQTTVVDHDGPGTPHDYSETISTSGASVVKTYSMVREGEDTITGVESISGTNTALKTRNVVLPNGTTISEIEDASTPSRIYTITNPAGNSITHTEDASSPSYNTLVSVADGPLHQITQDSSGINIARLAEGLSLPITIGTTGDGSITLGNTLSPVIINAANIDMNAATITMDPTP